MPGNYGTDHGAGYGPAWSRAPLAGPFPPIREHGGVAMPDLDEGLCMPGRSPLSPGAWDEDANARMASEARSWCLACPVLEKCRTWATRPGSTAPNGGIVGGLDGDERKRARREAA